MLDDLSVDSVWWCPDCGEPREVCKGECGQRAQDDEIENDVAVEQLRAADGCQHVNRYTNMASGAVFCRDCGVKI